MGSAAKVLIFRRLSSTLFAMATIILGLGILKTSVHPSNKPQAETSKLLAFAAPFVAPPRLPLGLHSLDIGKEANISVTATATDITKESLKGHLNTWNATTLCSGGASWLELAPAYLEYQAGEFSTTDDHPWDKPYHPFITPPKVSVFFKELDMDRKKNWRVLTKASDIDANGFTIHINSWDDSILYSAIASWIAYPEDRPYVFSGTANTQDIRPSDKIQLKNSKKIDLGGRTFWKTPNVFMAINSLDFGCEANIRIRVGATDVTQTGLTWHMDSWSNSVFYSAGVSILAVV
ncbi:unnamed protein product [Tuber aestivum]|uniref:H-type lectin domain-containing protein n=1 Tax=Tuber aestivum TaxID=59557 RepID=A0A292PQD7_9PEZI|nr:unnamed protein product [Tuber aestivum]